MMSDVQEIRLAEHAEAFVKQEQRARQKGDRTETGLENRQSKRKRIQEAKQKHAHGD